MVYKLPQMGVQDGVNRPPWPNRQHTEVMAAGIASGLPAKNVVMGHHARRCMTHGSLSVSLYIEYCL